MNIAPTQTSTKILQNGLLMAWQHDMCLFTLSLGVSNHEYWERIFEADDGDEWIVYSPVDDAVVLGVGCVACGSRQKRWVMSPRPNLIWSDLPSCCCEQDNSSYLLLYTII
jgi:hypothetical protein